jgi:hypothetical protein
MTPQGHQRNVAAAHEQKDADVINLFMIAGMLLLVVVLCLLVCWGVLHFFNRERKAEQRRPATSGTQVAAFPAPRLLVHPGRERKKLETTGRAQLESYGWVDRRAGIARIPVTRAMQLIMERGLPEVGVGQTRLQLMQARPLTGVQPNEHSTTPEATP